jgi:hypothetical protein
LQTVTCFIQKEELKLSIADSLRNGIDVERILIDRFRIPKAVLGAMLGDYYGCAYKAYDTSTAIDPDLLKNLSLDYLKGNHWVPLQRRGKVIDVVIDDPAKC